MGQSQRIQQEIKPEQGHVRCSWRRPPGTCTSLSRGSEGREGHVLHLRSPAPRQAQPQLPPCGSCSTRNCLLGCSRVIATPPKRETGSQQPPQPHKTYPDPIILQETFPRFPVHPTPSGSSPSRFTCISHWFQPHGSAGKTYPGIKQSAHPFSKTYIRLIIKIKPVTSAQPAQKPKFPPSSAHSRPQRPLTFPKTKELGLRFGRAMSARGCPGAAHPRSYGSMVIPLLEVG